MSLCSKQNTYLHITRAFCQKSSAKTVSPRVLLYIFKCFEFSIWWKNIHAEFSALNLLLSCMEAEKEHLKIPSYNFQMNLCVAIS